ncbi:MAG: tRNA 2-thiouridine(34) synthase MnmA [Anaerolineales bacterium]|nr:MAG: tRNA 2-thiouridine(34) synthase MnmA [Anaerolineales bacterium]
MSKPKVVVAMSGGVDSSVAAALLQQQGYEVIGMMLRLWSEPGREASNRCCTPAAMSVARRVAGQLGIPFYAINAQDEFHDVVVNYFLDGYAAGGTPNPCLVCNRQIRWEFLLNRALALGADYMATGHYVRLTRNPGEPVRLFEAVDTHKDQSYVLHVLNQAKLQHALFPLGELTKPEVRAIAAELKLPAATSKESMDLCFLAGQDYRDFLHRHQPQLIQPGEIVNMAGQPIGQHEGLASYTIGQRKGLGIAAAQPLYVIAKDTASNQLVVGTQEELGGSQLTTEPMHWVSWQAPSQPFEAEVKIRYSARKAPARVSLLADGRATIEFAHPLRDITPGQAAVIYRDGEVLGGGLIATPKTESTDEHRYKTGKADMVI